MIVYSPYKLLRDRLGKAAIAAAAIAAQTAAAAGPQGTTPAALPPNAANLMLYQEHDAYRRAMRTTRRSDGQSIDKPAALSVSHLVFDVSGAGRLTIVPPSEGVLVAIHQMRVWNTVEQDLHFWDGDSPNELDGPLIAFPAQSGEAWPWQDQPHYLTSPGQGLKIECSAGGRITGFVKCRLLPA